MICYCSSCPLGLANPPQTLELRKKYGDCPVKDPGKPKYKEKWRKCRFQRAWTKAGVDYRFLNVSDLDIVAPR